MKSIVVTTGDPAGCGPQICLEAIHALNKYSIDFFLVGDEKVLKEFPLYNKVKPRINLIDLNTPTIEKIKRGVPSKLAGKAALDYINTALKLIEERGIRRLVTGPVSKEAIKLVLPHFLGHTEYLAKNFGVKNFAMMMVSRKMKVVLFSRHLPLREVYRVIKKKEILNTLFLVHLTLKKMFKIKSPKIAFVSFNPHAGINTFLDKEERQIFAAIKEFCHRTKDFGARVDGPIAADTIFVKENLKKYHCLISPYHDQAMIPFKMSSFREGVNLTIGLPIIRTSPDHGVAYEVIRHKKKPFFSSMLAAIKLALKLKI